MASVDLTPPSSIPAIGADDVARVEKWAARQRAELSRLSLALRGAQVRAEQAERDAPAALIASDVLLEVLDSMLDEAAGAAQVAVQAAQRAAAVIVGTARERATDQLHALGLDPSVALGPAGWASGTVPALGRPASARELWQEIEIEFEGPEFEGPEFEGPEFEDLASMPPPGDDELGLTPRHADDWARADDGDLFEVFLAGEDGRRPSRHLVRGGLGRPPPGGSRDPTSTRVKRPTVDDLEPTVAFPTRWPDAARATWEFHGPVDVRTGHAPMPRRADDTERFDAFWGTPELVDVFWDVAEARRPFRDRLRRRATQEHR